MLIPWRVSGPSSLSGGSVRALSGVPKMLQKEQGKFEGGE